MIEHTDYCTIRSALIHFTGILGYNEDNKTWRQPHQYTPILAAFQFCVRVIMFEHAIPMHQRDSLGDSNPEVQFTRVRNKWLVEGQPGPFNYIHKLMVYGMAAAKDYTGRDKVWFSPEKEMCYYEGRPLLINDWIKFVHAILEDAEMVMKELLFQSLDDPLHLLDLHSLMDAPNYAYNGYSLVTIIHGGIEGARNMMMQRLLKSQEWKSMLITEPDALSFNPVGIKKYTAQIVRFLEYLLLLINTTCGLSGRGTEVTSVRYMNVMECLRNILASSGQIMFVTEYHKSLAIMDEIKVRYLTIYI
jgi:hypothetical protein